MSIRNQVRSYESALVNDGPPFASALEVMRYGGLAGVGGSMRSAVVRSAKASRPRPRSNRNRLALMAANKAFRRPRGLGDMYGGGIIDQVSKGISSAQEKGDKLETAIKAILVLSGIAALTGVVNMMK